MLVPGHSVICALGQRSRTAAVEALRDAAPYTAAICWPGALCGTLCNITKIPSKKRSFCFLLGQSKGGVLLCGSNVLKMAGPICA